MITITHHTKESREENKDDYLQDKAKEGEREEEEREL